MRFSIFFLLASLLAQSASAATTQQILRGTSDAFAGNLDLKLIVLASGAAKTIQTVTPWGTKLFDINQLKTGVVLYHTKGQDIVILRSGDFDVMHGGSVEVKYLTSGFTGAYDSMTVDVQHIGNIFEVLVNDQAGHHVVTKAFFRAKQFFGKVIGIESIQFSP